MKKIKEQIFKRAQASLLKRAFLIDGDGMCVRTEVAEQCIKDAINEVAKQYEPEEQYDFWGQRIS